VTRQERYVNIWAWERRGPYWSMLFQINEGIKFKDYDELHDQLIEKAKILLGIEG
jgi:hypothetical protein